MLLWNLLPYYFKSSITCFSCLLSLIWNIWSSNYLPYLKEILCFFSFLFFFEFRLFNSLAIWYFPFALLYFRLFFFVLSIIVLVTFCSFLCLIYIHFTLNLKSLFSNRNHLSFFLLLLNFFLIFLYSFSNVIYFSFFFSFLLIPLFYSFLLLWFCP